MSSPDSTTPTSPVDPKSDYRRPPGYVPRPEVEAARHRVKFFCKDMIQHLPSESRHLAVRCLAEFMDRDLTDNDLGYLTGAMEDGIRALRTREGLLVPSGHLLLETWDSFLPPPANLQCFTGHLNRVRDFAQSLSGAESLSLDSIADGLEVLLPTLLPYPVAMEGRMHATFTHHLKGFDDLSDDDQEEIHTLVWAYLGQDYADGLCQDSLDDSMWVRIRKSRPDLRFRYETNIPKSSCYLVPENAVHPPQAPETGSHILDELAEQVNMKNVLTAIIHQQRSMVRAWCCAEYNRDQIEVIVVELKNKKNADMNSAFLQELKGADAELFSLSHLVNRLDKDDERAVRALITLFDDCFTQVRDLVRRVDDHLITIELLLRSVANSENNQKFEAQAIRFERSKGKLLFKKTVDSFKTERLRKIDYSQILRPNAEYDEALKLPCPTFDNEHDSMCSICCDEWNCTEQGDIIVTGACCKKPFHAGCLWTWLGEKIFWDGEDSGILCCWCRQEYALSFIGDLLDKLVKGFDKCKYPDARAILSDED